MWAWAHGRQEKRAAGVKIGDLETWRPGDAETRTGWQLKR